MFQDVKPEASFMLYDFAPKTTSFQQEVLQGLQKSHKELPSKYLYDQRGSQLFEQICALPEYYPTRTELSIMHRYIHEIVDVLGSDTILIEYGSGSSIKTRLLLDYMPNLIAYVPIDISRECLLDTALSLQADYAHMQILPVCADYMGNFELPLPHRSSKRKIAYYPGSTIGNFEPETARLFLQKIANLCHPGGLLIGVDLKKDVNLLHQAYNDQQGITAQFNLNLLTRINHELDADFRLDRFRHYAFYNPHHSRIEMHLESLKDQAVHVDENEIKFALGESVWTESSYKYTLQDFDKLAISAGFQVEHVWMDENQLFSVQYLATNK